MKKQILEDKVKISGPVICPETEKEIKRQAAAMVFESKSHKKEAVAQMSCHFDAITLLMDSKALNGLENRLSIKYENILGFYLTPSDESRIILVFKQSTNEDALLLAIHMSSPQRALEVIELLAVDRSTARQQPESADSVKGKLKTVIVRSNSSQLFGSSPKVSKCSSESAENNGQQSAGNVIPPVSDNHGQTEQVKRNSKEIYDSTWNDHSLAQKDEPRTQHTKIEFAAATESNSESTDEEDSISIGFYDLDFDDTQTTSGRNKLPKHVDANKEDNFSNAWLENITYISNDPKSGNQATSSGSVYMYVAQQMNPRDRGSYLK